MTQPQAPCTFGWVVTFSAFSMSARRSFATGWSKRIDTGIPVPTVCPPPGVLVSLLTLSARSVVNFDVAEDSLPCVDLVLVRTV